MTIGTATGGQRIGVAGMPGVLLSGYWVKTWNGGDYLTRLPKKYEVIDTSFDESFLRVRKGKQYIVIKHRVRRLRRRIELLQRRASTEYHPYSMTYRYDNQVVFQYRYSGNFQFDWQPATGADGGGWFGDLIYTDPWNNNDTLNLIGKLREKVAGSDFNFGVFLGEGNEALKMIGNAATRIARAYESARKGNFRKARRFLVQGTDRSKLGRKVVASNWLELQYGWLPLLKDAQAGAEFLAHHFSVPLEVKVRVRSSVPITGIQTTSPTRSQWGMQKGRSRGQIVAILKEKDVVALSGLLDPASVVWEKLPYSFVIDWFLPIGNYLSARGLSQSLTGTFVTTRSTFAIGAYPSLVSDGFPEWQGDLSGVLLKRFSLNRTVSSTLEVPQPSIKGLAKVASWKHCANAVALLSQLK